MAEDKVVIIPYGKGNMAGMDVVVKDNETTIADLSQALEDFILNGIFKRTRAQLDICEGCDLCCQERIPLTSVDAVVLKEKVALESSWQYFFKKYCYIVVQGPSVDISLALDGDDKCNLLQRDFKKCLHYQWRPFACRTYICTYLSPLLRELRDIVVNTGEDELVRLWLEAAEDGDGELIIHEALDPCVEPGEWLESIWTGKSRYNQIFLKDLCPPDLWTQIYKKGDSNV